MAGENAKVVLGAFDCIVEGDFAGVESRWHPEARITAPKGWPERGPFVGRRAVMDQLERLVADFDRLSFKIKSLYEHGDWVVVDYDWITRGAESGIESRVPFSTAFRVREGLVTEGHYRWTHAEALEAAGLSEKAES